MAISQEQLESLERRLQLTIDEKVNMLRTELISEARSIVESYQRSDRTSNGLQEALDKIRQEVLRTVRSSVSSQISAIRAQQERDISQLTTSVASAINDKLRSFKNEVSEYTNSEKNNAQSSQIISLEQRIKQSLQQLDNTSSSFQNQFSSLINMIRKEKSEISGKMNDVSISQAQVDEEEKKIRYLQAEIAQRERQLAEEKAFLQQQTEAFIKEKRQTEKMRLQSRKMNQDRDLEKSILRELQSIRKNLASSVASEASSVVEQLRKEVDLLAHERERMRSAREMMLRAMAAPGTDMTYSRFAPSAMSRFQTSIFHD